MARSTAKVILFSRVTQDGKTFQWPTAVFANHDGAKAYATMIKMAHTSGNVDGAKSLDPKTAVDDKGKLLPGLRFSIAEVAYDPQPSFGDEDLFGADETATT